jgi:hypothetical protein
MPLFVTDNADDTPDIFAPPPPEDKAGQSKGVFSSIVDSLNPFSSKKP